MLFPTACPACGGRGPAPCARCVARMRPAPPGPAPPGVAVCRSLLLYEGAARELLVALKYRNHRASLAWLAGGVAGLVDRDAVDVVTWAPTQRRRRDRRGFDQAELLARAVGRRLGRPVRSLLTRGLGPPQTGRTRAERRMGPTFTARTGAAGRRVLVVDDVVTTGATVAAAAAALINGGANLIVVVTAARTPLKVGEGAADA